MTDIIERLHSVVGQHFPVCVEAADEITRLLAEVESLRAAAQAKPAGAKSGPAVAGKPLTDAELREIENRINPNMRVRASDEEYLLAYPSEYFALVSAIEAHHGIHAPAGKEGV